MIIKLNGLTDMLHLDGVVNHVVMQGFDFYESSMQYVPLINSLTGTLPDYTRDFLQKNSEQNEHSLPDRKVCWVGVFCNNMVQDVVTRIYNHDLDYVELQGEESNVFIENLKRSVVPDIHPRLNVIKKMPISSAEDFLCCKEYGNIVDAWIFSLPGNEASMDLQKFDILRAYEGQQPYLLNLPSLDDVRMALSNFKDDRLRGFDISVNENTFPMADVLKLFSMEV